MTNYFERDIAPILLEALKEMPVVVLTGMRQTGKSTFLQQQPGLKKRKYVTLDDFEQLAAAKADPEGFITSERPLTIDEAHKCPEILTAIKNKVARKRIPGHFLLSGSANFAVLKGISETLAGRAVYYPLQPFTRREVAGSVSRRLYLRQCLELGYPPKGIEVPPISDEEVLQGGMPSVVLKEVKNRLIWFKGFEQTYLERDLRELSQIGNIISFRHLLHLAALRTGQLLVPSQLSRDAKLNVATTSRYLSLLEASFIINRLSPYLRNRSSRLIKSPKIYMSDSGLACFLAGIDQLKSDPLKGAFFETYVAQNLQGILSAGWPEAGLYFWHVQGRHEVDFIIEAGHKCLAVEIKSSARWTENDLSGLRAFLSTSPHCSLAILAYNGSNMVKLGDRLWALPIGLLLS
ncbi:MAG TPA: ATP-binding protein [Thermodesulfobacteriota bacterium]|nr:ATP-binding protein [Thermodesulfobacteriota bacterium]